MALELLPIGTGSFYEDVGNMIHNALFQLTLTPEQGRSPKLVGEVVQNIEMDPVVWETLDRDLNPAIYISTDSSGSDNDSVGVFGYFIEVLNFRIQLYLGCDNDNEKLTTRELRLVQDFQEVLKPTVFIGAPIGNNEMSGALRIVDENALEACVEMTNCLEGTQEYKLFISLDGARLANATEPAYIKIEGQNSAGTNFSEYIFYNQATLDVPKWSNHKFAQIDGIFSAGFESNGGTILVTAPISSGPKDAQILNAGIAFWGFDEDTRGTSDEVLAFVFDMEVHHYIQDDDNITTFIDE